MAGGRAPRVAQNGGGWPWDRLHAAWNVGVLAALLPAGQDNSPHVWLSPTATGAIQLSRLLLLSGPWIFDLWQQARKRLGGEKHLELSASRQLLHVRGRAVPISAHQLTAALT